MTNAISFPLCRLPSVACDCVVKQMRLREKYLLTTLSKRAREAVRVALLREVYTFNVRQDCNYCVIGLTNSPSTRDWFYLGVIQIGSELTQQGEWPELWTEDLGRTLAVQLGSMNEVFKCSEISLSSRSYDTAFDILKQVVPVIKRLKLKIIKTHFEYLNVDDNFFEFIMESFKDADTLINFVHTTPDYEWKETEPFNFRRCTIWAPITMEHVTRLFMNCKLVKLYNDNYQITADSLNGFLKKWIEGSALEYAKVYSDSMPNCRSIMDGIESVPVRQAYIMNRLREFADGDAVKIRQKSGVEAVVFVNVGGYFVLTTRFDDPKSDLWTDDEDEEVDDEIDEEDVDDEEEDSEEEDVDDEEEVTDEEFDDEMEKEDVVDEDEEGSDYDNANDADDEEVDDE